MDVKIKMKDKTQDEQWTIIEKGQKKWKCKLFCHDSRMIIYQQKLNFVCFRCNLMKILNPMKIGCED